MENSTANQGFSALPGHEQNENTINGYYLTDFATVTGDPSAHLAQIEAIADQCPQNGGQRCSKQAPHWS